MAYNELQEGQQATSAIPGTGPIFPWHVLAMCLVLAATSACGSGFCIFNVWLRQLCVADNSTVFALWDEPE